MQRRYPRRVHCRRLALSILQIWTSCYTLVHVPSHLVGLLCSCLLLGGEEVSLAPSETHHEQRGRRSQFGLARRVDVDKFSYALYPYLGGSFATDVHDE